MGRNVQKTDAVAKDIALARPGSKVLGLGAVDVRDVESLRTSVETCVRELGGIDFLMCGTKHPCPLFPSTLQADTETHRAGAAGNFLAPISQLSPNAFKSVMDIDVLGSYNVTKLCLPHLVASASANKSASSGLGGRIIYFSATMHYTGLPLQAHVCVAKAGVDALSANVCLEYGPLGVTSNIIAPGPIQGSEGATRLSRKPASSENRWAVIPAGRPGTFKDVVDATVFLFSDASNYVNGLNLIVDGGVWHNGHGTVGAGFKYPDFLLKGEEVTGIGGSKRRASHL